MGGRPVLGRVKEWREGFFPGPPAVPCVPARYRSLPCPLTQADSWDDAEEGASERDTLRSPRRRRTHLWEGPRPPLTYEWLRVENFDMPFYCPQVCRDWPVGVRAVPLGVTAGG